MSVPTQRDQTGPDTGVQVILARLEGKVDAALARQGAQLDGHTAEIADHENRIRGLEGRPTVSPKTLWSVVATGAGVFAVISPFLDRLYSLH